MPYLSATVSKDKAEKVALDTLSHFFKEMQEKTKVVEEEEEGEDLCNCEFSLAYGTCLRRLIICIRHSVLHVAGLSQQHADNSNVLFQEDWSWRVLPHVRSFVSRLQCFVVFGVLSFPMTCTLQGGFSVLASSDLC